MSKLSEMLYGDIETVSCHLDAEEATNSELRAALQNAFSRIRRLEERLDAITETARAAANTASCLANGIRPD